MNRKHVTEEQLIDYIEGELTHEQRWTVKQHLRECESCSAQFNTWKQALTTSNEQLNEEDKRKLWDRIQIETERKREKKVFLDKRLLSIGWSVTGIICLFIGYLLGGFAAQENHEPLQLQMFEQEHVYGRHALSLTRVWNDHDPQHIAWYNPSQKQFIVYVYDPNVVRAYAVSFEADLSNFIAPMQTGFWSEGELQYGLLDPYLINLWYRCGSSDWSTCFPNKN